MIDLPQSAVSHPRKICCQNGSKNSYLKSGQNGTKHIKSGKDREKQAKLQEFKTWRLTFEKEYKKSKNSTIKISSKHAKPTRGHRTKF